MKLCFVASSGGHWEELMCLDKLTRNRSAFYVTENGGQSKESRKENVYTFRQINRKEKRFVFHLACVFLKAFMILIKERPDAVITTGALLSFPFCVIAKILRIKVIYIESFARVVDGSITGKLVYRFADLFIVQWKSLKAVYPKAVYVGGIF